MVLDIVYTKEEDTLIDTTLVLLFLVSIRFSDFNE